MINYIENEKLKEINTANDDNLVNFWKEELVDYIIFLRNKIGKIEK